MVERYGHATGLWTALDGFMGRAQDYGGLVHSVGGLASRCLLVSGSLASHELSKGPLPVPSLVVAASRQEMKKRPLSVAILDPGATVLMAAEVLPDKAVSRVGPQDEDSLLPYPHMKILTDSAHTARPHDVDSFVAELLFQQIMAAQDGQHSMG